MATALAQNTLTVTTLLQPPSETQIEQQLLASLQADGFPITDWESGGLERTIVEMEVDALTDLVGNAIPTIVGGGFLSVATGDWLTFLAAQIYLITRNPASFSFQMITLFCAAGAGPINLAFNQLSFLSDSGNVYTGPVAFDDDDGPTWTVPDGGSIQVPIQSDQANDSLNGLNYVDPAGTITTLTTQIAGLTCNNVAPIFSDVAQAGIGTGTVTPSETSSPTPPDPHSFTILIMTPGDVGVATFAYSTDGGAFSAATLIVASFNLPGLTTIAFANGATTPISFAAGDQYTFSTPGSPTVQQGTDEENDGSLTARCQARWPSLSLIPTEDRYVTWAKQASSQITRVRVYPDATIPGQMDVVVAGQAGGSTPDAVTAATSYIQARQGIGFRVAVVSADMINVVLAATVYAPASKIAAVQAAVQAKWVTAVAGTDFAGEVVLAQFVQLCLDSGASDVDLDALTMNGSEANLTLGPSQLAQVTQDLVSDLTWIATKG